MSKKKISNRLTPLIDKLDLQIEGEGDYGWWLVPSPRNPRLAIPTNPLAFEAAISFLHSFKSRVLLRGLLNFFRLIRKPPHLSSASSPLEHLNEALPQAFKHLVVNISTPNCFSKYTLMLLDQKGIPAAFAKMSEAKNAEKAIKDEADALERLAKFELNHDQHPDLLYFEPGLSVQSASPKGGQGFLSQKCGSLSRDLFRQELIESSWGDSATNQDIESIVTELKEQGHRFYAERIEQSRIALQGIWGERLIKEGWSHGDLVPWNAVDSKEGFVYDWEWMKVRGEGHDQFHYFWFSKISESSKIHLEDLWRMLPRGKEAEHWGIEPDKESFRLMGFTYLLVSLTFYSRHCLANGEDPKAYPFIGKFHSLLIEGILPSKKEFLSHLIV